MTSLERVDAADVFVLPCRGQTDQLKQSIGHFAHRRDHHRLPPAFFGAQNFRHPAVTIGIGQAGAAKFMNHPLRAHRLDRSLGSRPAKRPSKLKIMVRVKQVADELWQVTVTAGTTTEHEVRVTAADVQRFGAGRLQAQELLEASFRFLLEREPNTGILRSFDLPVIARYFPEYEREIAKS